MEYLIADLFFFSLQETRELQDQITDVQKERLGTY